MIQAYSPSSFPQGPVKIGKTIKKWILYLVILGIAGVFLYWFIVGRGREFKVNLSAKKGTVEYRENEKADWKTVESLPLKIGASSEIRTLSDSEASLSVEDGSIVRLGSFSRIVLSDNQGEVNWIQTDGDSHHQVAKNAERKSYKVSISDGEFESLGTAFELKIKDTDTTVLVLKDQLKALYKDKSTAEAKAGQKIVINPVGKSVKDIEREDVIENWTLANLKEDQKNNLPIDNAIFAKADLATDSKSSVDVGETEAKDTESNSKEEPPKIGTLDNSSNNNIAADQNSNTEPPKVSLEAKSSANGALLNWNGSGDGWDSWKILKGTGKDLNYPNDSYRTVSKETKSYLWEISGESNTYYFRICAFSADKGCVVYSDAVSLTINGSDNVSNNTNVNAGSNETVASDDNPQNQNSSDSAKSGVTTRKKCEGSGGHWSQSSKVCKCPPNEIFVASVGRCKKN